MKLLLPKTHINHTHLEFPMIYLAGPIRGAADWQAKAATTIDEALKGKCLIVNPSRYSENHPLYQYKLSGNEVYFPHQTAWERHYMREAAGRSLQGVLMFWIPKESEVNPRPREEGPYGQDTYGELGEWRTRLEYYAIFENMRRRRWRVVFGAAEEGALPGLRTIIRNHELALGGNWPIKICSFENTLERTIVLSRDI